MVNGALFIGLLSLIKNKVFSGNSSLRRQLTLCNTEAISTLTSGLEFDERKGEDKLINKKMLKMKSIYEL